jgi:hypothetical protein
MDVMDEIEGLLLRLVELLGVGKPRKRKPKRQSAPPRELTELERVQAHFAFLRDHAHVAAECRLNSVTDRIEWNEMRYDPATGEVRWSRW